MLTMLIEFENENGDILKQKIPAKYSVCASCDGIGTELYGSMKGYAYTAQELIDDPEFTNDYIAGRYDIPCNHCEGKRVELVPDVSQCNLTIKRILVLWRKQKREREDARQADKELYWSESGTPISERY